MPNHLSVGERQTSHPVLLEMTPSATVGRFRETRPELVFHRFGVSSRMTSFISFASFNRSSLPTTQIELEEALVERSGFNSIDECLALASSNSEYQIA